jgi:hypothetical protein
MLLVRGAKLLLMCRLPHTLEPTVVLPGTCPGPVAAADANRYALLCVHATVAVIMWCR